MICLNFDSTRVKIDLDAISANFDALAAKTKVPVMAVVKADAYGHGAIQVARLLQDRAAFFGVSSFLEATELRRAGLTTPILILGHTPVKAFDALFLMALRILSTCVSIVTFLGLVGIIYAPFLFVGRCEKVIKSYFFCLLHFLFFFIKFIRFYVCRVGFLIVFVVVIVVMGIR